MTDYDEGLVRRLIERIAVFEDRLAFEFKCGLETEVQMETPGHHAGAPPGASYFVPWVP